MRIFSGLVVAAATQVGTVQLNKKVAAEIGDVTLGKVLADQLKLAPKIDTVAEATAVSSWSSSMFEKPAGVFLAVIGGGEQADGVALDSSCAATKECVGGACYASELPCVAKTLLTQTKIESDLQTAMPEASVVVDGEVAKDVNVDEQLRKVAQVDRHGSELTVKVGAASATLDATEPCVQRLVGEAASILSAKPAPLVVLTPRSVSCMQAQYGEGEQTKVATALITAAVKSAEKQNAGSFSVIVNVPSRTPTAADTVLIESERRLDVVDFALKAPLVAGVVNFHIYGWTSLALVLTLLGAVYSIVAMTNDRDPLLYAKFRPEVDATTRR
jgi:hypothetical protein